MVVGGYQNGKLLNQVEIISKDPNNNCTAEISKLPVNAQGMVGGFTKRAALACGGADSKDFKKECYEYLPKTNRYIDVLIVLIAQHNLNKTSKTKIGIFFKSDQCFVCTFS